MLQLNILLNGIIVEELSMVVHASKASSAGRKICLKLKDIIPRQLIEVQQCCLLCVIISVQHTRNFWQLGYFLIHSKIYISCSLWGFIEFILENQTAYKNVLCCSLNMIRMVWECVLCTSLWWWWRLLLSSSCYCCCYCHCHRRCRCCCCYKFITTTAVF